MILGAFALVVAVGVGPALSSGFLNRKGHKKWRSGLKNLGFLPEGDGAWSGTVQGSKFRYDPKKHQLQLTFSHPMSLPFELKPVRPDRLHLRKPGRRLTGDPEFDHAYTLTTQDPSSVIYFGEQVRDTLKYWSNFWLDHQIMVVVPSHDIVDTRFPVSAQLTRLHDLDRVLGSDTSLAKRCIHNLATDNLAEFRTINAHILLQIPVATTDVQYLQEMVDIHWHLPLRLFLALFDAGDKVGAFRPLVRECAIQTKDLLWHILEKLELSDRLPLVREALENPDLVREALARVVAHRDHDAIPVILRNFDTPWWGDYRREAIDALARFEDPRIGPFLVKALDGAWKTEQIEITKALGRCGGFAQIEPLALAREQARGKYRRILDEAIARIQDRVGAGDQGWLTVSPMNDDRGALSPADDSLRGNLSPVDHEAK